MGQPSQEPVTPARAELAARLRSLRMQRGMTQRELARSLTFASHSSIGEFERGSRIPAPDVLSAYERFLGLPTGELLGIRDRALIENAVADERRQVRSLTESAFHPVPGPDDGPTRDPRGGRAEDAQAPAAREDDPGGGALETERLLRTAGAGRPWPRLLALCLVVLAGGSSAWQVPPGESARHAPHWATGTVGQNRTDHALPAAAPEPMDGDDPRARDCFADAVTLQQIPILRPELTRFGTLRLRHSHACGGSWASAYYANPQLYTVTLVVHRPHDGAVIPFDWHANTPPGSYGDMLSTGTGCVWVEGWVTTRTAGPHARTDCLTDRPPGSRG
jgi:transcriptional regulator with XRE-family HTH domain